MASPKMMPQPQSGNASRQQAGPAAQTNQKPNANLTLSAAGRQAIIQSEGFIDHYYNDQAGHCTYGVGTLVHRGPCTPAELRQPLTQQQIYQSLDQELVFFQGELRRGADLQLTQRQFDALVSLTYNAGVKGAAPVFDALNKRGIEAAATLIPSTAIHIQARLANGRIVARVSSGLVNRRHREAAMFRSTAGQP